MISPESKNKAARADTDGAQRKPDARAATRPQVPAAGGGGSGPREFGGPKGPEPTRYGDWERKGRCIDF
ncbi:MAG: DUF1674 domain-containing protein [Proteobacteria bacterium]|nr:MAG: DUF1674 domain-containing protein [Pseudomonadota bacterium]